MKRVSKAAALVLAVVLGGACLPGQAQYRDGRPREWRGDIQQFHQSDDLARWRSGRWVRGSHDGRRGWWWVVDGTYYAYPEPVYPYPDPYTPAFGGGRPPVAGQAPNAPVPAPDPNVGLPSQLFYCDQPRGWYPYVAQCQSGWRPVAAIPPGPSD